MSSGLATSVVMALFLLVTSVVFLFLISAWTNRSLDTALAVERQLARVESGIEVKSPTQVNAGVCDTYTIPVDNTGEVLVEDFSNMDVLVEYTDTNGNELAARLKHDTSWSVTGITPDTRDASLWNAGETATISFTLSPTAKDATSGTVIVITPLAISDSEYFDCSIS